MIIIIKLLNSIFHKLVVAAFVKFANFVVFADICIFLAPKLLHLLAVDLNIAIPLITILLSTDIFNVCEIVWHGCPRFSQYHFLNHWLPVRYRIIFKICTITYQTFSSEQSAYLHSPLTPARQSRYLVIPIYFMFLFPVLRQMSELELFQLLHRLRGTHSLLVLSL